MGPQTLIELLRPLHSKRKLSWLAPDAPEQTGDHTVVVLTRLLPCRSPEQKPCKYPQRNLKPLTLNPNRTPMYSL